MRVEHVQFTLGAWTVAAVLTLVILGAGSASANSPHSPISIVGNDALLAAAATNAWPGNGTHANPVIISGYDIIPGSAGGTTHGILLSGTTLHVVIRDMVIEFGGPGRDGIVLHNARNVTVTDSTIESNRAGIVLADVASTTVSRVTIRTSTTGLQLQASHGNVFTDNRIQLNAEDVRFTASSGNTFTSSNLSISAGQTGWFFADNASYDNAIDRTNVVNGVPTEWHVRPVGTTGAPFVIDRPNVTLKGITNIAQVMVYQGRDVEVRSPATSEGSAAGLVVFGGERVRVTDAFAERNKGAGIFVEQTAAFTLAGATTRANEGRGVELRSTPQCGVSSLVATSNGRDGLSLTHAPACLLTAPRAEDNVGLGISVVSSPDARIDDPNAARNQAGGILIDNAPRAAITRASVTGNGVSGVRLVSSVGAKVDASTLTGNALSGIHLSNTATGVTLSGNTVGVHTSAIRFSKANGATLSANTLAINATLALQFDDEDSFDNVIGTTNLVNGRPVHWYTHLIGTTAAPILLPDLAADVRGMTNVAQIMVYKSENVTLERPIARNGTGAGIRFFASTNSTVDEGVAQNNTGHGIDITAGRANRVQQTDASNNGGAGIRIDGGGRNHALANVRAERNLADGLSFRTSDGLDVRDSAFNDNRGRGIAGESSSGVTIVYNSAQRNTADGYSLYRTAGAVLNNDATRNAGAGYSFNEVPAGARLESNRAIENAQGVRLRASPGLTIKANEVTLKAGGVGFHFDDEGSYANLIDTTNIVNGTPMRWYHNVHGNSAADPLVLSGVNVSTHGMTNVAQLFVSASSNLSFDAPVIRAGTVTGVRVVDSTRIVMENALVESNAADGIKVLRGTEVRVANGTIQRNVGHGILLDGASHAVVGARILDNTLTGLTASSGANLPLVENATIERNAGGGIVLIRTTGARVDGNQLTSNGPVGIDANQNTFLRAARNTLSGHASNIRISAQTGAWFDANVITLAPSQYGFSFDRETSYTNHLNETNLVDGTPVRWYTGDQGGRIVSGVSVGVPRITNLAQIVVYAATNLTFDKPYVANGSAHGILIQRSTHVKVDGGNITNNAADGIRVDREGTGVVIQDAIVSWNRGSGITVAAAENVVLEKNIVTRQTLHGISLELDTRDAIVTSNVVQRNTLDGIRLDRTILGLVTTNDVYDNGGAGIALSGTQLPPVVRDNVLANHPVGIRLTSTVNTRFTSNTITILPGQTGFHFGDTASYDNIIDTTNVVNGVAVQWHLQLAGTVDNPVRLVPSRVELRGITNVAQIMLYRASYVVVDGATASNGTGHGIYLYASSAVDVTSSRASNNTHGISLMSTVTSTLQNNTLHGNVAGIYLDQSRDVVAMGNDATDSATGVRITGTASNNRIYDTFTSGATVDSVSDVSYRGGKPNQGLNFVVDAGLDKVGRINLSVAFDDATGVAREQRDSIVSQTWRFGDGTTEVAQNGNLFQAGHAYTEAGVFVVTYEVRTLAGETYSDTLLVEIIPNLTPPRDVTALARNASVMLNWTVPLHDSGLPVERYRVYRSADGAPTALIDELRNVTNYTDVSVVGGRTYQYLISAVNSEGESARSEPANIFVVDVPTAPARLTVVELDGNTTFTWQPADGRGALVEGYRVYGLDEAGNRTLRFETGNVTSHDVAGLAHGDARPRFIVTAFHAQGEGLPSTESTLRLALRPDVPERFEVRGGDGHAILSWRAPTLAGSSPITHYNVHRAVDEGAFVLLGNSTAVRFNDTSAENGRTYAYRVSAVNEVGEGAPTRMLRVQPGVNDGQAPTFGNHSPATGATVAGPVTVSIDYDDPSGIALDSIVLLLDGVDVTPRANVTATGLTFAAGELRPGTYRVVVRVEDAAGNFGREVWTFDVVASVDGAPVTTPVRAQSGDADGGAQNATAPSNKTAPERTPARPTSEKSEKSDEKVAKARAVAEEGVTFAQKLGIPSPGLAFAVAAFVGVALARKRRAD